MVARFLCLCVMIALLKAPAATGQQRRRPVPASSGVAPANVRLTAKLSQSACNWSTGAIAPGSWKLINATLKAAGVTFKEVLPVNCLLLLTSSGASADAAVAVLQKAPAPASGGVLPLLLFSSVGLDAPVFKTTATTSSPTRGVVAPANPRIVIAKLSPSACDQSSGTISPSSWKLVNATLKEAGLTLNRVMPVNCWLSLSTSGAGSADAAVAQLQKAPAAAAGLGGTAPPPLFSSVGLDAAVSTAAAGAATSGMRTSGTAIRAATAG